MIKKLLTDAGSYKSASMRGDVATYIGTHHVTVFVKDERKCRLRGTWNCSTEKINIVYAPEAEFKKWTDELCVRECYIEGNKQKTDQIVLSGTRQRFVYRGIQERSKGSRWCAQNTEHTRPQR